MIAASGVIRIELLPHNQEDEELKLLIVGKPDSFENLKIILEFQKADHDEINHLKYQLKMLRQQLYFSKKSNTPSSRVSNGHNNINNNNRNVMPKNFADAVKASQ